MPPWSWTPSTRSAWPRARSTTYAGGSSRRPSGTAAARATRSTPIRRILLRGAENLTENAYGRLLAGLGAGDPAGQVAAAYIAAQELRHLYGARDLTQARHRLHRFYVACADPGVPELERLGRTISAWEDQLLAHFTTAGVSNGPTEAVNLLIKRIKRVGFGFRNFANYRLRLLLHCGIVWHTHPTTRIRGRSPRSMS
jgi:transposase